MDPEKGISGVYGYIWIFLKKNSVGLVFGWAGEGGAVGWQMCLGAGSREIWLG